MLSYSLGQLSGVAIAAVPVFVRVAASESSVAQYLSQGGAQ